VAITTQDLINICGLESLTDSQAASFIATANMTMDLIDSCLDANGVTNKDLIASWLACHYLSLSPIGKNANMLTEEKFEGWSGKRAQSKSDGKGFTRTYYGETATTLSKGCLAELDKRKFNLTVL